MTLEDAIRRQADALSAGRRNEVDFHEAAKRDAHAGAAEVAALGREAAAALLASGVSPQPAFTLAREWRPLSGPRQLLQVHLPEGWQIGGGWAAGNNNVSPEAFANFIHLTADGRLTCPGPPRQVGVALRRQRVVYELAAVQVAPMPYGSGPSPGWYRCVSTTYAYRSDQTPRVYKVSYSEGERTDFALADILAQFVASAITN